VPRDPQDTADLLVVTELVAPMEVPDRLEQLDRSEQQDLLVSYASGNLVTLKLAISLNYAELNLFNSVEYYCRLLQNLVK
jgi:hypothetical protein